MLNYNLFLEEVGVYPLFLEKENVIQRVIWRVVFSDTELEDEHITYYAETLLDINNISNFIQIEDLTKDQILEWALNAQGGQSYIDNISLSAEKRLNILKLKKQTVKYDISLLQ